MTCLYALDVILYSYGDCQEECEGEGEGEGEDEVQGPVGDQTVCAFT